MPKHFELPKKVRRRIGWELWLKVMDTPDGGIICRFCLFTNAALPKAIYRKFNIEWQPIMKKMESNPGMRLPVSASVNQDFLNLTFKLATSHLRENFCSFFSG